MRRSDAHAPGDTSLHPSSENPVYSVKCPSHWAVANGTLRPFFSGQFGQFAGTHFLGEQTRGTRSREEKRKRGYPGCGAESEKGREEETAGQRGRAEREAQEVNPYRGGGAAPSGRSRRTAPPSPIIYGLLRGARAGGEPTTRGVLSGAALGRGVDLPPRPRRSVVATRSTLGSVGREGRKRQGAGGIVQHKLRHHLNHAQSAPASGAQ